MSVASRGPVVKPLSKGRRPWVRPATRRAQRASERPPPERGLTMTSGRCGSNLGRCTRFGPAPGWRRGCARTARTRQRPIRHVCALFSRAMLLGIVLGLCASASWALANVAVQRSARHVGAFRAILWAQIIGGAVVALALPLDVRTATPAPIDALWVLAVGAAGLLAYVCLFYAFEHGRLTIAVPVMSSWAVIAAGLSLAIFREPVRPLQLVGAAGVVAGAVVLSRFARATTAGASRAPGGARAPRRLLASFGAPLRFGLLIPAIGLLTPLAGRLR